MESDSITNVPLAVASSLYHRSDLTGVSAESNWTPAVKLQLILDD